VAVNFVAKFAITAAMMAAQMALTMSQRIKGPRLDNLDVTVADYGVPIPRFWGIRRFETPIIWAEKLKEKKKTSKTKGGKYTEYRYFGTFAVLITDVAIDAVTRIWMDKHLVYDTTREGPISIGSALGGPVKIRAGKNMRIYRGTEDQLPDPRMEAWCEDRYGPDSCPAYRGSAYVVFEELPLEKFGNRIPQITIEAVREKTTTLPYETVAGKPPGLNRLWGFTFSPDYSRFITCVGEAFEIWDTAARARLVKGNFAQSVNDSLGGVGLRSDGSILLCSEDYTKLYRFSADGNGLGAVLATFAGGTLDTARWQAEVRVRRDRHGVEHWITMPPAPLKYFFVDGAEFRMEDVTGIDWLPAEVFNDVDGNVWMVGRVYGVGSTNARFLRVIGDGPGPSFFTVPGLPANSAHSGNCTACAAPDGMFVLAWNHGGLYRINPADGSILASRSIGLDVYNTGKQFANLRPGDESLWIHSDGSQVAREISLRTLADLRTANLLSWKNEDTDGLIYDPVNHALICGPQIANVVTWRYLDRIGAASTTLKTVVDDVCSWVGIEGADTTQLTQPIAGYSVTQGSAKDMIAPLLDVHDVDARPHDFSIQFLNRGSSPSGATLLTRDFVRAGREDPRYRVTIAQDGDLPRRITLNFADRDKDQQTNTVISQRPLDATASRRDETIDLTTYVASPAEMQPRADRFFRRLWNSRETIANGLTAQELRLEPGDVRNVELDGIVHAARLKKIVIRGPLVECEWVRDDPSLAQLGTATGAPMDGRDDEVITLPSPSKGFVLDMPLARDADNDVNPILYLAAGSYITGGLWPGAAVLRGDDGSYDEQLALIESSGMATWGYATGVLASRNPNLWDRGSGVNVRTYGEALTSATEDAIDADPMLNLAAIGRNGRWELIQFATTTLQGDGSYTLTRLKRGRRGTEGNVGNHAIGDEFVLIGNAVPHELGLGEIGNDFAIKAVTIGRAEDSAFPVELVFAGNTLKPYAPGGFRAWRNVATGDWNFEWARRTRVGGAWIGGTAIPIGEASEAYELAIPLPGGGSRTIASSSPSATWTAAEQSADFGAPQASLPANVAVYQLSDSVGRGFAARSPAVFARAA